MSVTRSSRRLLNTHTGRSIQGSWCSSLAKGKFVSGDWNSKVRNTKEKKSLNAKRKDVQGKIISGKKMKKEDLLLWR